MRIKFINHMKLLILLKILLLTLLCLLFSSCSKNIDSEKKSENYYLAEEKATDDFSSLPHISQILKSEGYSYICGKKEVTTKYEEKYRAIDVENNSIKNIDVKKLGYNNLHSVFVVDDYIIVRYNDTSDDNVIDILECDSFTKLKSLVLNKEERITDCISNKNNEIEIVIDVQNQYGSMLKSIVFDLNNNEFRDGREYGIQFSIMNKIFVCNNLSDVILVRFNYDDNSSKICFSFDRISANGTTLYSTEEYVYDDETFRGVFMNRKGNICAAYIGNEATINIDEYTENEGIYVSTFEFDASSNMNIVQGASSQYDFIMYDSINIFGCEILSGEFKVIYTFDNENSDIELYESGSKILLHSILDEYQDKSIVLKLDNSAKIIDKIELNSSMDTEIIKMDVMNSDIVYLEKDYVNESIFINKYDGWNESTRLLSEKNIEDEVSFCLDYNGNIYLTFYSPERNSLSINVYSSIGEKLFVKEIEGCCLFLDAVKCSDDGIILSYYNTDNNIIVSKLSFNNMAVSNIMNYEVVNNDQFGIYQGDNTNSFYYLTKEGLFGCTENGDSCEIINWIDNDLYLQVKNVCTLGNGNIILYAWDYDTNRNHIFYLTRADDKMLLKLRERNEIIVGGYGIINSDIYRAVKSYNRKNKECHIKIIDYSFNENINEEIANLRFIQNIPDIIINTPEHDYSRFNHCMNLSSFIQDDIDSKNYFENIIKIYQNDNEIYKIPISFDVLSFECSDINANYNDINSFIDYSSLSGNMMNFKNKEDLIRKLIIDNAYSFINFQDNTCDFNNQIFCNLLNYIKSTENVPTDNRIIYSDIISICNISGLIELENKIGHKPLLKGIPGFSSCENLMDRGISVSISNNSKNKSEALKFVKTLFEKEFQDDISYQFPVLRDSFVNKLRNVRTDMFYIYGGKVKKSSGEFWELDTMKNEYINEDIFTKIESTDKYILNDIKVEKILYDEILDYLSNDNKTEEETAKIIQNKTMMYLKEIE